MCKRVAVVYICCHERLYIYVLKANMNFLSFDVWISLRFKRYSTYYVGPQHLDKTSMLSASSSK